MIGTTLAHYHITAALGAGGMGEVWRATDTRLGREVALKVLPAEFIDDPQRLDRFEREARAVAALNHPHIVTIYSVEDAGGVRFLTMELVEGKTLEGMIPEQGFELETFFAIATPLAEAISAAHDKNVIHRDLKPSNVMVDGGGRVKVMDFGLAKLQGTNDPPDSSEMATEALTGVGTIVGTVPYMSPEQVEGKIVDHRTDVFSLGVLVYEMATGRRPFQGDSSPALMSSILKDVPVPMLEIRSDLPRHLGRVVGRCLEKDRRDRYQTARDVFNELKALQRESSSTGAPGTRPPAAPSRVVSHPSSRSAVSSSVVSVDEGFWVAVLPFKYTGGDADLTALAEGLSEDIVTGLSRFSYLRVIARSSTLQYATEAVDVRVVGEKLGARYVMEGSLRRAGKKLRLAVQLVDTDSGAHLWAEAYDRDFDAEDVFALQDELVPRIVSTVADTHGVLPRSMGETLRSRSPEELSPYEAVLRSFSYFERVTAEELAAAREALELAVQKAPDSADAWAMLALLCAQEYGQGFDLLPDSLATGAAAAKRAVEVGPSNHLAHFSLAQVLFFQKEFGAFRNAAARAAELNPMDGNSIAFLGELLTYVGDSERGLELSGRAKQLNPTHPGWYWYANFFDAYRDRDYPAALAIAQKVNLPDHWGQHTAIAVTCGQLGDRGAAGRALKKLLEIRPDFAAIARQEFVKWWDPELVEQMLDGLRKAGLDVPASGTAKPEVEGPASVAAAAAEPRQRQSVFRRWLVVGAAATVVAIAVIAVMWMRAPADRGAVEIPRLTVLPFADLSSDTDQEWLAAGTHEALLTALQQIGGLRVTSRTSSMRYRETALAVSEIARELDVSWLVEGSVSRVGDGVRITAQLVEGATDQQVWADQFEGDVHDILALQNEAARKIAAEVHAVITPEEERRLSQATRVDPEVYRAYIRGLSHFDRVTPADFRQSIALFGEAIALDPTFAPAQAALASAYGIAVEYGWISRAEAAPLAERAASTARRLDPDSPEALRALADYEFHMARDFTAAEQSYRKAMATTSSAYVRFGYGWLLSQSGRHAEAVAALEDAVGLDPRSALVRGDLGWWLFGARDYVQAIEEARFAIELDPSVPEPHWLLAASYAQLGRFDEAEAEFARYEELYGESVPWFRGYLNALAGRRTEALRDLAELERRGAPGVEQAQILLGLSDRDGVIDALERSDAPGVSFQPYLWPEYEAYFNDPRFRAVLERFGLPLPPTGETS